MGDDEFDWEAIDSIEKSHSQHISSRSMPPPPNTTAQHTSRNPQFTPHPGISQGSFPVATGITSGKQVGGSFPSTRNQTQPVLQQCQGNTVSQSTQEQLQQQIYQLQQQLQFQQQQMRLDSIKTIELQQQVKQVVRQRDQYQQDLVMQNAELQNLQVTANRQNMDGPQSSKRKAEDSPAKKTQVQKIISGSIQTEVLNPLRKQQIKMPRGVPSVNQVYGYPAFLCEQEINVLNGAKKICAQYPKCQALYDAFNKSICLNLYSGDFRPMVNILIEFLSSDFQKNIWGMDNQVSKSNFLTIVNACILVLCKLVKISNQLREYMITYKIQYKFDENKVSCLNQGSINAMIQSSLNLEQKCEFLDEVVHILEAARNALEQQIEHGFIQHYKQENDLICRCFEFIQYLAHNTKFHQILKPRQICLEILQQLDFKFKYNNFVLEKQHYSKFQNIDFILRVLDIVVPGSYSCNIFGSCSQEVPEFIEVLFKNFELYKHFPNQLCRLDFVSQFLNTFRIILVEQTSRNFPCEIAFSYTVQNSLKVMDEVSEKICQKFELRGLDLILQLLELVAGIIREKEVRLKLRQTICYQKELVEVIFVLNQRFGWLAEREHGEGVEITEQKIARCRQIISKLCQIVNMDGRP